MSDYNKFSDQQKEVLHLLKVLNDNDILPHVLIAGSWAEYVYYISNMLPGFEITLRTIDLDFLIRNKNKPTEKISLTSIIKQENYSVVHDTLMGTTKFFSPGGLEVEFLIGQKGSGTEPILETHLGVNAQALRHMEHIVRHAVTANVFDMNVLVPCPESYVLHKMLINDVRKPEKQEKDRNSIMRLLPFIDYEKAGDLFSEFSKKEKSRIRTFVETHGSTIRDNLSVEDKIRFANFTSETVFAQNCKNKEQSKEI